MEKTKPGVLSLGNQTNPVQFWRNYW